MNNLIIKNKNSIQDNFLGFNAVYHGFAGMEDKDGRNFSEELCDLEADRAADLGVKVARTRYQWIAYDWEKGKWDWENSPEFNAFCRWAKRLKDRGIDVALNALWSNMVDIMGTGWGGKSPLAVGDDWKKSVENYAWWVSESIHQMVEVRGLTNVKYLVMFTEPQCLNGRKVPEGAINHFEAWYYATKAASDRLKADGRRHLVKLIGPNEGGVYHADMMKWLKEKDPDLIDIYSAHAYLNELRTIKPRVEGDNILQATLAGTRIFQKVDLKPNTKYEFSFYIKLEMENPENASGYVLAGAFNLKKIDFITSGGSPTNRLGRYTTKMLEAARIDDDWQLVTIEFETPDDATDVAVGMFSDISNKSGFYKLYFTSPSLKEKGSDAELFKNTKLLKAMEDWGVIIDQCRYIFDNQYDFWEEHCESFKSVLDKDDDFWVDEYNTVGNRPVEFDTTTIGLNHYHEPGWGTDLAIARVAFLNAGIQSSMQWTIFDQLWPNGHESGRDHWDDGVHAYGVMPCLLRSKTPKPAYFAVRVAGLLGGSEGTKAYAGEGNKSVRLGMTKNPDGEVAILVVNESKEEQAIEITFEEELNTTLKRYSYDPATVTVSEDVPPLQSDKTFDGVTNKIIDTIPAGGVYTYTNKRV